MLPSHPHPYVTFSVLLRFLSLESYYRIWKLDRENMEVYFILTEALDRTPILFIKSELHCGRLVPWNMNVQKSLFFKEK